jgi:uncharacterized membrane protein
MDKPSAVRLDGNAAGGLLAEVFALDVTSASLTCGGCGAVGPVGEAVRCARSLRVPRAG